MRCVVRKFASIFVIGILISCVHDKQRDPIDVARHLSQLEIPRSAEIMVFEDQASGLVGEDLWVKLDMRFTASELAEIESEARREGFTAIRRPLSDDSILIDVVEGRQNAPLGYGTAVRELAPGSDGLLKFSESDSTATTTVLLDLSRRRMWIFAYIE